MARGRSAEGEPSYRLMLKGEREVSPLLALGPLQVIRFDGSKPRAARLEIGQLLCGLSGTIRICDPYYGLRTLDTLESIPTSATVRFLSGRTNEAGAKLSNAIRDFRRERPKVDLRAAAQPSALHDRYVLSSSSLLLVGHGLKDIGAREVFQQPHEADGVRDGEAARPPQLMRVLAIIEVAGVKEQNDPMAQRLVDVENLTPDQQLELIGELWDRLSMSPADIPLTGAQRTEIDRRSADLDEDLRAGRPLGIPWDEVLTRIRSRL